MGVNVKTRTMWLLSAIGVFILLMGMIIGMLLVFPDYQESKDAFNELCLYTNKVTNLSNMQSDTIAIYNQRNLSEVPKLNYFDCIDLQGRL